jgi:CRISPR system Cascade subunit CasD
MTHTLLLRLVGPMQSWGVQSRFTERDTLTEPSKSGVVGLLCAAQGLEREAADTFLADFNKASVRMGVRVDREGILKYDWHTAGKDGHRKADGKLEDKTGITSRRYYLADACFLVGLESENLSLLQSLIAALANPVWALYLGRKAFVPSLPPHMPNGLKENTDLETALKAECRSNGQVRLILEDAHGSVTRPDQPLSFCQRKFTPRRVSVTFIPAPEPIKEAV